ncbi:MAG: Zn-ribbon domain-containing OB-fold protein [Leucobacter sp.]
MYWDALKDEGRLLIQRCGACGSVQGYARRLCAACWKDRLEWHEARGAATVVTHSLVHRPGQGPWAEVAPYYVGLVRLDEGAVMLTHLLTDGAVPRVGDSCEFEPVQVGDWVLPFFRLKTS